MAAITDANIISSIRGAPSLRNWLKAASNNEGAGTFSSQWKVAGNPAAGANPPLFSAGSGYVPTKATTGAYPFTNAAVDGDNRLLKFDVTGALAGLIIPYDRLWACSGFGTVVTTLQSVTTPGTLPTGRDPNTGIDVEPWLEVYTAPGATAATWTLTGTDALGNTGRTWIYAHPANAETVGQMVPFIPGGASPAAVLGCRQVTGFQCSVSSGTAGDVGVTLLRRYTQGGVVAPSIGDVLDALRTGLPPVYNDSCVAMVMQCTTNPNGVFMGQLLIGEGV
jgi:hypothetical protein